MDNFHLKITLSSTVENQMKIYSSLQYRFVTNYTVSYQPHAIAQYNKDMYTSASNLHYIHKLHMS